MKIHHTDARGVLTIRLLNFENHKGRTYDGSCCDQTTDDSSTCPDQCDYVMRLIISGLGRANDHVFLFHRPLKYDANDISFQEEGTDMVLTILFDEWPNTGHVKMNVFFYDYDDYDHTTLLVDWFENELKRTVDKGQYQRSQVQGNRQSDKTKLEFEWSVHCFTANDCLKPPPEWKSWPWDRKDQETKSGLYIPKSTSEKTPPPSTTLELTNETATHQWKDGKWKKSHNNDEVTRPDFDVPAIRSRDEKFRNVRRKAYGTHEKTTTTYEGINVKAVTNVAVAPVAANAHKLWPGSQDVNGQSQRQGNAMKLSIKSGTKVNRHGFRNPYTRPSDGGRFVKTDTPAVGNHAQIATTGSTVRKTNTRSQPTPDVGVTNTRAIKGKTKSGWAIKHGIPPFSKPNENNSSVRKQDVISSSTYTSVGEKYYSTSSPKQPISRGKTLVPNTRAFNDASTDQFVRSSDEPADRSTISTAPTKRNPYNTFKTASWKWIQRSSTETSTDRLPHTSSMSEGAIKSYPSYRKRNDKNHTKQTVVKKPTTTASRKTPEVKKAKPASVKKSPWRKPTKSVKQPQDTSDVTVKKLYFPKDKWQTQSTTMTWDKKPEILTPSTQSYFWHASTTDKHHKGHTGKPKTVTSYRDQYTTQTHVRRWPSPSKPRRTAAPTITTPPAYETTRRRFGERKRKYFGGALKNRYQLMYEAENENRADKAKPMVRLPSKATEKEGLKSTHHQQKTKTKLTKKEEKAIPAVVVGLISKKTMSTKTPPPENDSRTTNLPQTIRKTASRRPFQPWSKSSVTENSEPMSTTQNARKTPQESVHRMQTSSPPSVQAVTRQAFQSWATSKSKKQSIQTHQTTTNRLRPTSSARLKENISSRRNTVKPTAKVPVATKTRMKPSTKTVSQIEKKKQHAPLKSTTGITEKNIRQPVRPTVRPLKGAGKSPFAPVKPTKQTDLQDSMLKDLKSMVESSMKKMIPDDINIKVGHHTMTPKHTTLPTSIAQTDKSPFKTNRDDISNYETSTQVDSSGSEMGKREGQTTVAVTPSRSAAWTHFTRWWQRPKTFTTLPPLKILPAGVNEGKVLHVVDEYKRMKMQKTNQPKSSHSPMKFPMSSRSKTTAKSKAKVNRFVKLRSTTISHPTHATTRTTKQPKTTQMGLLNGTMKKPVSIKAAPRNAAAGVTASTSKNVHNTGWNSHKGNQLLSSKVTKSSKLGTTTREKIVKVTKKSGWTPFTKRTTLQLTTSFHTTAAPRQGNTGITRLGIRIPGRRNTEDPGPDSKQITDKRKRMTGHQTASSTQWDTQEPATRKPSPVESPFKKKALPTTKAQIPKYPLTRWGNRKPMTNAPRYKSNVKKPLNIKTFYNRHTTTPPQFASPSSTRKWRYMTGEKNVDIEKTTNIWEGLMSTRIITNRRIIPTGPAPTQKTPFQLKDLNKLKNWERQNQAKKTKTIPEPRQNDNARQKNRQNAHEQRVTRRNYAPTRIPVMQSTSRRVTRWWQRRTSTVPQTLRTTTTNPTFRKVTLPPSMGRSTRWWKRINRNETPRTTPATFDGTSTKSSRDKDIVFTLRPTRWWRRVKTTAQSVSSTSDGTAESWLTTIPTNAPTKPWQRRRKGKDKSSAESNQGRKSVMTTPDSKNVRLTRYTGHPTRFWQRRTTPTVHSEAPTTRLWKKKSERVTKQASGMFSKHSTRSWRPRTSTQSIPATPVVTSSIFTPKTTQTWERHTRRPFGIQKTSYFANGTLNTKSPLYENKVKNKKSKADEKSINRMDSTPKYQSTTRTSQAKSWQQKKQRTTQMTTKKPLTYLGQGRTQRKYPLTTTKPVTKSWQQGTQEELITTTKPQTKPWQRRTKTNHVVTTAKSQTKSWQRRTKTNDVVTTAKSQTKSWQRRTKTNDVVTTAKPQTKSWQRRTKTNDVVTTTKPQTKSWQRRTKMNDAGTTTKPQTKSWQRRTKMNHVVTTAKPQTKSWQRRKQTTTSVVPQTESWQRRKPTTPESPQTRSVDVKNVRHHTTSTPQSATKWWERRRTINLPGTTFKTDSRNSGKSTDQTSDYLTKAKHMWTTMPLPDAKKDRGLVTTSKIETTVKMKGWNIFEFLPEILSKMYNGESVEEMNKEKTSSAAAGANPNPKHLLKSASTIITSRPLVIGNDVTKKTALTSREKSKILKSLMPTTGEHDSRSTIRMHQQTSYRTSTLPTIRGRNSSTRQQIRSTARPKDASKVTQTGINHTVIKGEKSTSREAIKTTTQLTFKEQTSTKMTFNFRTTLNTPHVTREGDIKISTSSKNLMASLSTTSTRTGPATDKRSTPKGKATVKPTAKIETTLSSILKTTTKPVKIDLTLPNWISFPTKKETSTRGIQNKKKHKGNKNNKTKNNQKKKTQSKPTAAPTKKDTTTKKTPPKTPKRKPDISKPKAVKKKIDLKTLMKKKSNIKKKSDVKKKVNTKAKTDTKKKYGKEIGINVSIKKPVTNKIDTKKKIISRKIVPRPTVTLLNKTSDKGPRVIVPNDGLFVPGPTKIVKIVTSQKDENGTITEEEVFVAIPSNSEAQQIGLQVKRLNIQTVFNRYWPAILGLTIGTVFLVAAVLTSVACRAQRLYVQRSRYNDQPQHLTEPPDTSEYSSSAASLVSDATRSSIRL
ncbi:mucin-2-like [Haliotis asinina]|uniref:mucin-2-like n=1 Tax=Haliotis asinina TaxID=109174 RepID=UPI0035318DF7